VKPFAVIFLLAAVAARSATITVTDSIGRAIESAQDGDTVLVPGPRVFQEHVTINNAIRLVGTNAPCLDGGKTGTTLTIDARDVEVSGFMIRNSGSDLSSFDSAIMVFGSGAKISGCRLENDGFGVYIRGATNCSITGNMICGATNTVSATRGNGINLWKTRKNRLENNQVRCKRDGIYLSYADENLISTNRVEECRFGIHYMYSHQNRLLANTLTANTVGATLMFARSCVVEGNQVFENRRHGILLKQFENSRLTGNFISGHNRGLFVQQATGDRFERNVIKKNDIGLYLSGGSEQNAFVENAFVENADQVWQPPDEREAGHSAANVFYEKGRGNFWSDYAGGDAQGDGIGDTPYHETDVFGYIVDRHPEARIFALSPAVSLLRKGEEILPLLETSGVTDLFPLMNSPSNVGGITRITESSLR
jgi:nitrous oxidase accessory protein